MMLGDKLHAKEPNKEYTRFLVESRQTTFYTHVLKVYINFQRKKTTTFKSITKINDIIPLRIKTRLKHDILEYETYIFNMF
jgi:hypothetical protein